MPKSTLEGHRRHFDSAAQHVNRALEHALKLKAAGFCTHPAFAQNMADAQQAIMVAFSLFVEMRKAVDQYPAIQSEPKPKVIKPKA